MNKDIIPELLSCPVTKNKLSILSNREGFAFDSDRAFLKDLFLSSEILLIDSSGKYCYAVKGGIFFLMKKYAYHIPTKDFPHIDSSSEDSDIVERYYEEFGWKNVNDTQLEFNDSFVFEDLRKVTINYFEKCHKRLSKYLGKGGKYFLDAASGPIQYKEYLEYSANYEYRVCLDFSPRALMQVKKKLGNKAICIVGDLTNVPIQSNVVDSFVSLHTIYHIPEALQKIAFEELFRVLKFGEVGAVVYSWANPALPNDLISFAEWNKEKLWFRLLFNSIKSDLFVVQRLNAKANMPSLYFFPHSYEWFMAQSWSFKFSIFVWRALSVEVLEQYIPDGILGKFYLRILYLFERLFSQSFSKICQYPIIQMKKD
ncbi:class I SAM-dependent methyltransferase [Leptospira yasudae]|uniref:Class I SAM-dependent methyltransferase n=1 Tax=Leptospira yasudae TaxID=2202201 RepID=A0A6N4QEY4_9LEPT|nr:class I SAM-dependent methyltransferase [Leptospira yasudae]TGL75469.1 class I SAM-dependent methyltransferase [Leptospira yasudae]TGL89526.1 class I SAM-dependent methyltransferase [Leptospira yasudae]